MIGICLGLDMNCDRPMNIKLTELPLLGGGSSAGGSAGGVVGMDLEWRQEAAPLRSRVDCSWLLLMGDERSTIMKF